MTRCTGLLPVLTVLASCGGGARETKGESCAWGVDELLAVAGVEAVARTDCGSTNAAFAGEVRQLFACFGLEAEAGNAVEFTLNHCVDCANPSTYVFLGPPDRLFEVRMEADALGDDRRTATVERCAQLVEFEGGVDCTDAELLYSCQDALRSGHAGSGLSAVQVEY